MYAKSATTITHIIKAAQLLFTTRNYADVTMTAVAEAADVTKGALYHHFASKEEMYLTMMHNFLEGIHTLTEQVVRESVARPCRERLRNITFSFLNLPEAQQELMRLVRRDINTFRVPEREQLVRAYQRALPEQIEAIIRDGIMNGEITVPDARLLSWEHVAIVEVVLRPYSQTVLGNANATADFVMNLFFDGVGSRSN